MEFKKCSGYHGKCYHSDDMIVPIHMFSKYALGDDGLQPMCDKCKVEGNRDSNAFRDWAYKGRGITAPELADLYREHPEERKADKIRYDGLNVIKLPTKPVIPRFDDGAPSTGRKHSNRLPSGATREGPGFVYIYQDERIPEDLKIGAEKVSHDRLRGAGTWGFYRCVFNAPFERRFEAEREVHQILASKRIVSNKEIFKCSILEAQVAIETVALRDKLTEGKTSKQGE